MCGIGGILKITKPCEKHEPIPEAWLDALDEEIKWRGPDGAGRFRDRVTKPDGSIVEVALVHRRLSIIDLEGGHQPFIVDRCPRCAALADERWKKEHDSSQGMPEPLIAVVFNGCVYNHRELRRELEALGHVFTSDHSDTEVIAHGSAEWNDALSRRLNGMFACAIWNRSKGSVQILRDRFGEKPLFAGAIQLETTSFASSAAAVASCAHAAESSAGMFELDPGAAADWMVLGYDALKSPWRNIRQSRPSETIELGCFPGARSPTTKLTPKSSALPVLSPTELNELIATAVSSRLEADVPLGVFLSGGVDSSLIAAHARRALGRVTSVCMRMPDSRYDESAHAQRIANVIGTDHHTSEPSRSAAEDFILTIQTLGLPFADSSILPTLWICRAMRQQAKVALSGDGGDELFAGYERYRAAQAIRLPAMLMILAMFFPEDVLNRADPKGRGDRLARFVVAVRNRGYSDLCAVFPSPDFFRLTTPRSFRLGKSVKPGPVFNVRRYGGAIAARAFDIDHYLPGDLLRKVDTASLLSGLEVRCPMLHPLLAQRMLATPWRILCPNGRPKAMAKDALAQLIPRELIDRPKQGFAIPISEWWRTDFGGLGTLLFDYLDKPKPFGKIHDVLSINMDYVRQMIDEHWAAGGLTPKYTTRHVRKRDHGQRLFALVSLAIWAEQLDQRGWGNNRPDQIRSA